MYVYDLTESHVSYPNSFVTPLVTPARGRTIRVALNVVGINRGFHKRLFRVATNRSWYARAVAANIGSKRLFQRSPQSRWSWSQI